MNRWNTEDPMDHSMPVVIRKYNLFPQSHPPLSIILNTAGEKIPETVLEADRTGMTGEFVTSHQAAPELPGAGRGSLPEHQNLIMHKMTLSGGIAFVPHFKLRLFLLLFLVRLILSHSWGCIVTLLTWTWELLVTAALRHLSAVKV
ncbi:hypothetical protein J6590_020219 [Homalodisca vitripennis]|nr:hypothetical protein J6590_020219 [Homalodisca vitripennis]